MSEFAKYKRIIENEKTVKAQAQAKEEAMTEEAVRTIKVINEKLSIIFPDAKEIPNLTKDPKVREEIVAMSKEMRDQAREHIGKKVMELGEFLRKEGRL